MKPLSLPVRLVLGLLCLATISAARAGGGALAESIANDAREAAAPTEMKDSNARLYLGQIDYALTILGSRTKTPLKKALLKSALAEARGWKNVRDDGRLVDRLKTYEDWIDSESFVLLRTELAFDRAVVWGFL